MEHSLCNSTFTIDGGDSQEDQVQAIDSKVQTVDRKLVHVSTTLRKHGAGTSFLMLYYNLKQCY